jgi:tRNA 2-thiouridine synthesizing protein C
MMSHSLLIICRQSPNQITLAQSAIDAALAGGIFEQDIGIAFIGDAVQQLIADNIAVDNTAAEQKNLAAQIQALPLYGIEKIFLDNAALQQFAIGDDSLKDLPHQRINGSDLRQIMNDYHSVLTV